MELVYSNIHLKLTILTIRGEARFVILKGKYTWKLPNIKRKSNVHTDSASIYVSIHLNERYGSNYIAVN
jgi:hypothetical protein